MTERCVNVSSSDSLGNTINRNIGSLIQRDSVESIGSSYTKLSKRICELIIRCADTLDVCPDNLGAVENADITHIFTILKTYLDQVIQAYSASCHEAKVAKDENNRIRVENSAKIKLISDLESRLSSCKKQLEMLRSGNSILEQRNEMFRKQLEKYKKDVRRLTKEHSKAKTNLENLQRQYEQTKRVNEEKINQLTNENVLMENKLMGLRREVRRLSEEKQKLERGDRKVSELMDKLQEKAVKIDELERINTKLLATIGRRFHEEEIFEYPEEEGCSSAMYPQFMSETHKLKQYMAQMEVELNRKVLRNHELEVKLGASENNIMELKTKLSELARNYDSLKRDHDTCQIFVSDVQHSEPPVGYEERLKSMQSETETLRSLNHKFEDQIRAMLKMTFTTHDCGRGDEILPEEIDNPLEYLQERITSLVSTNSQLTKTATELRSAVCELRERGDELRNSCNELSGVCQKLKADLTLSEKRVNNLELANLDQSHAIVRLSKKAELLEDADIDVDLVEIPSAESIEEEFKKVSVEKQKLICRVAHLQSCEEELCARVKQLEAQVETQVLRETALETKIEHSENYILHVTEELQKLQQRLGASDAFNDSLKEEKEHLNAILQSLSRSTDCKTVNISALQRENVELLEQIHKLTIDAASMSDLKRELKLYEEQITCLNKVLEEKDAAIQADLKEIHRLNDLLDSQGSSLQHLKQVLVTRDEQISSLENEVSGLKCSLEQNINTVRELQHLVQNIESEYKRAVDSFKQRIDSLEKENHVLENANRTLLDKVIKLGVNIRESTATNERLLVELKEAAENTVPKDEFVNTQLKYVSICAEKEKLEQAKIQLEETCENLSKRIEMLTVQMKNLQESAEILEKCNDTSRAEIQTLRKVFSRNRLQNDELQNKLISVQEKLIETTRDMANFEELYQKETTNTASLREQLEELHMQVERTNAQMETDLKIATDNVVNLKMLYEHECEKSSDLMNEVQKLRNLLEIKQQQLNEQNSLLSKSKSDLGNKLETIKQLNAELVATKMANEEIQEKNASLLQKAEVLNFLESKLEQTQRDLNLLSEECATSKAEMESLSNSKCNLSQQISQLTISNQELEIQVHQYSSMLSEVGDSLKTIKAENIELEQENIQLKFSMRNLHQAISSAPLSVEGAETFEQQPADIKEQHEQLLENIIELRNSNVLIHNQNEKLASELDITRRENVQLMGKVSELSSTLQVLERDHNELCQDLRNLRERCNHLTSEKDAKEEENMEILTSLNELELRRNDMLRSHIVSIEELSGKLRQYDEMQGELESIKAEKEMREQELMRQQEKLSEFEDKLKMIDDLARKEREMNKRQKRDVAILQAKLLKSRQVMEQNQKQWDWERSKLIAKIQEAEQKVRDHNNETRNRFENMKNKVTQCSTVDLSRMGFINALSYKGDNTTETSAALQILSQSELQTNNFCPSKDSINWKTRCLKVIRYPFAVVVFNMILTFFLKYTLSKNNMEIVVRRTVPSIILERESIL